MSYKSKQEQIQQLQLDSLLKSMMQAVPGGPVHNEHTEAFEHKKRALEAKLKAESTLDTRRAK